MAREKHLTAVHIGNFKRFADFQVENLGQFNLVVGDNNTGKTSFLEALVVDEEEGKNDIVSNLEKLLRIRNPKSSVGNLEDIIKAYKNQKINKNELAINFSYENYECLVYLSASKIEPNKQKQKLLALYGKAINPSLEALYLQSIGPGESTYYQYIKAANSFLKGITENDPIQPEHYPSPFLNFTPFGIGYDGELEKVYDQEIEQSLPKIKKMLKQLELFIPNAVDIRLRGGEIHIYESDKEFGAPLYTYGEGAVKFFRILCYMSIAKGKRLMIDEIDTGIHHTKFIKFWTTLMQAAIEYDVQLFATTHNEECLEYFQAALEQEELAAQRELARVILLRENKDQSIFPQVYDYADLQEAEEMGYELRGRG